MVSSTPAASDFVFLGAKVQLPLRRKKPLPVCLLILGSFPPANPFLEAATSGPDQQKKQSATLLKFQALELLHKEWKGKEEWEQDRAGRLEFNSKLP